jgi:nicotinamide riboside transporter PnuC
MSSTEPGGSRPSMGMPSIASGARMPIPGNAEFALWAFIEIVFVIIWIAAESVDTRQWVIYTTVLTAFYMLSRGIAKASRVLEQ